MATHQVLEKLELDLDAQGINDPDYREFARVTVGKVLITAHDQRPTGDGGGIERREPVMSLCGNRTAEIDPDGKH